MRKLLALVLAVGGLLSVLLLGAGWVAAASEAPLGDVISPPLMVTPQAPTDLAGGAEPITGPVTRPTPEPVTEPVRSPQPTGRSGSPLEDPASAAGSMFGDDPAAGPGTPTPEILTTDGPPVAVVPALGSEPPQIVSPDRITTVSPGTMATENHLASETENPSTAPPVRHDD